jgi:ABC-2 type transport system ATP-binding protein
MIKVSNLTKTFGQIKAVDNISFKLNSKIITGLLGPNGAGKTTTMRMLTGLITPDKGKILINNKDIKNAPLEIKKSLGYLPEENPLYSFLTVKEYLNFISEVKGVKNTKKEIKKYAHDLGIEKVIDQKIENLSKGYKQRVGLSASLLGNPDLLILDEATSGLDPNQRIEIRDYLNNIKKTILFSSHILSEVQQICDEVIIINEGKIIAQGKIDKLLKARQQLKVGLKNTTKTKAEKEIKSIKDIEFEISKDKGIIWLTISSSKKIDLRKPIWEISEKLKAQIYQMEEERQDLENIFSRLTKKQQ